MLLGIPYAVFGRMSDDVSISEGGYICKTNIYSPRSKWLVSFVVLNFVLLSRFCYRVMLGTNHISSNLIIFWQCSNAFPVAFCRRQVHRVGSRRRVPCRSSERRRSRSRWVPYRCRPVSTTDVDGRPCRTPSTTPRSTPVCTSSIDR